MYQRQRPVCSFGTDLAERIVLQSRGSHFIAPESCRATSRMVTSAVAAPEAPSTTQYLKVHTASEMSPQDVKACIARPRVDFQSITNTVCLSNFLKCRAPSDYNDW